MIEVKSLCKSFDGFKALDNVDMHVESGSVYGLMGPNGAGKTTLLLNIVGAYKPDSGEVLIDSVNVHDDPSVKSKTVFIPDEVFYFTQSTPLSLMRYYRGIYPQFDTQLFSELQSVFTEINLKKPVRKMSKGMKKQLAFWLSLCCKPDVLILDEPVDGLDPVMRHNIWQLLISRIAKDGMTVLISSHNLRELEDVCDHIGIMNHGRIILESSLNDLQKSIFKIQTAFEGEFPALEEKINILNKKQNGKMAEIIVKGEIEEITAEIRKFNPIICETLPMTLEDIFIYELGGIDDEIAKILI